MSTESQTRNHRKVREGIVTSAKMVDTTVVTISEHVKHPLYGKIMTKTKKLHAHDAGNQANEGDRVRVMETRPLSKAKRWRVVEIVERAR